MHSDQIGHDHDVSFGQRGVLPELGQLPGEQAVEVLRREDGE